jgi:ABC-2 type transport system ATP-binding protein
MIVAENLCKSYGGHRAIDQVSFKINAGEIVGLLGLNGAGKSTILKILGCFLMPSSGSATVSGYSVAESPEAIRALIGYLPDTPPLYNEMTVSSYLRYVARLKNVVSSDVAAKVEAALHKTSTKEVADFRLGELSHGFRQRVGIAQALVHDPKVLILDEPINGLDPVQIVEMRDLILSLRKQHTVVLSSHILSEITRTCDRILIVDQGRLVAEGGEEALQRSLTSNMRLMCDIERDVPGLEAKLSALPGVTAVSRQTAGAAAGGDYAVKLSIETVRDVRSEVAKVVVENGAGLLSLSRFEAGLESLFMKMVRASGGER